MSRAILTGMLAATLVVGVLSRVIHAGWQPWDKSVGDALYAVAMFLVFALVAPRARISVLAGIAMAACTAIELFQLTAFEQDMAGRYRVVALLLGTTFAWHDLACYAVGVACIAALTRWTTRRTPPHHHPRDLPP